MPIVYKNETGTFTVTLGALIAIIVLIICILMACFLDKPLTGPQILGLIGALALARLT